MCYRTWRRRALCVLDMFGAYFSRQPIHFPILLIRSESGVPVFSSPLEAQKLSVGTSIFTCCERNHVDSSCYRDKARQMLIEMNREKVRTLFEKYQDKLS